MESVDLLNDFIETPIQSNISKTKYPCTGFCYLAIKYKKNLLNLFLLKKRQEYFDFISKLIRDAGERKNKNKNINCDGEFINQETIKNDFPEIYDTISFKDLGIASDLDLEIFINNIFIDIMDLSLNDCLIINRSSETFLAIKIDQEDFLIIDSHQNKHGIVQLENLIDYITKFKKYRGNIQIGFGYSQID